jgi:hypothetical protein
MMMSIVPCYIKSGAEKKEKKIYEIYIKRRKKKKREKEQASPTWQPQNTKMPPSSIKNSHFLYLCCLPPSERS